MKTIRLASGHDMPLLGLGTWQIAGDECKKAVKAALYAGYTHIDTADRYKNHQDIAEVLDGRNRLFITTKVNPVSLHHDDVLSCCDRFLKELRIDYIDLLLIHWPNKNVPMKETFDAFAKLIEERKVRSVGVSNFTIRHLQEAIRVSKVPICVNQVEFHPYLYQKELLDFCVENKIVVTAYSPLAQGEILNDATLNKIAQAHGKNVAQVAIRWVIQKNIVAIPRSRSAEHIKENFDVFGWKLSAKEMEEIDNIPIRRRLLNPDFAEFDDAV